MSRLLGHYVDRSGRPAIDAKYLDPQRFEKGVARVSSPGDGRMGLIDRTGRVLIDYRYDFIEPFVDGLARTNNGGRRDGNIIKGGVWGLVAADGTAVAEPTYDTLLDVGDGRVTFASGGKFGFLDTRGAVVVGPRYDFATWHADGLAVASIDGADGYVDLDGNVVIEPRFQEGTAFSSGVARVKQNDAWGMIDKSGAMVHEAIYERLGSVRDGACWAVKDGRCCVLTSAGTILGDAWFDEVRQVAEDGIWPVRRGETWGFLRPDGELVALEYEGALGFLGGLGRVQRGGAWGFANADGALVIPCRYGDAWGFAGERAAVLDDDGWTFVDPTGHESGSDRYDSAGSFADGLAAVRSGDRWGYVDRDGGVAVQPFLDWAGNFADGLAAVLAADRTAVAVPGDRDGVHVLPAGGLTHPVFEGMGPDAHLISIIGFSRFLDPAEQAHLGKLIDNWERAVHPAGKLYTENRWVSPFNLYLRVQNLADPRADVALLLADLTGAGLPINETLFSRWGHPPDEKVMRPNADPRMGNDFEAAFDDFPAYWDAVWSSDGPAPAPENYYYLRGALQTQGGLCLEERHMPMWFPDVRICMGALSGQGEQYDEVDDQADQLYEAVRNAIDRRFAGVWIKPDVNRFVPQPMVRSGEPGIERITYEGRTGYSFAFECGDLLHWFSAARMRYREPELMQALREVIQEANLEPVIMWQRFQEQIPMLPMGTPTVLVINLWDRPAA